MAIDDNDPRAQYDATPAQDTFTYPFEINEDSDLKVYQTPVGDTPDDAADLLTLTTHYTVTGAGDPNGTIILVSGATEHDIITIERDIPLDRSTDFITDGDHNASDVNTELDDTVMFQQQQERDIGRAIVLSKTDTTESMTLPSKTERASKSFGFDADGNPAMGDLGVSGVTASADEINTLDGITATTAELNIMDGVTASAAELNIMDGVTLTAAEINAGMTVIASGSFTSSEDVQVDSVFSAAYKDYKIVFDSAPDSTVSNLYFAYRKSGVTETGNATSYVLEYGSWGTGTSVSRSTLASWPTATISLSTASEVQTHIELDAIDPFSATLYPMLKGIFSGITAAGAGKVGTCRSQYVNNAAHQYDGFSIKTDSGKPITGTYKVYALRK